MAENIARTDSGRAEPCGGNGWRPANEASLLLPLTHIPSIAACALTAPQEQIEGEPPALDLLAHRCRRCKGLECI